MVWLKLLKQYASFSEVLTGVKYCLPPGLLAKGVARAGCSLAGRRWESHRDFSVGDSSDGTCWEQVGACLSCLCLCSPFQCLRLGSLSTRDCKRPVLPCAGRCASRALPHKYLQGFPTAPDSPESSPSGFWFLEIGYLKSDIRSCFGGHWGSTVGWASHSRFWLRS